MFVCFEQSLSIDDEIKKSLTSVKLSDSRSPTEMKNASTETQVKFYLNVLRLVFKLFNRICVVLGFPVSVYRGFAAFCAESFTCEKILRKEG